VRSHQSQAMIVNSSGIGIVDTKNVLVLICLGRDQDLMQQSIDVRSALKRRVSTFGYIIQPRRSMESKPYSIAM
jgi:hypothetical protein